MSEELLYFQWGEQHGIGATMHFVRIGDKTFIIDCGIGFSRIGNQNYRYLPEGNFLEDEYIDFIIITHAHNDHIGAIPRLVRAHPESWVVIHHKTLEAASVIFDDGLRRIKEDYRIACKSKIDSSEIPEMTYDENDVERFIQNPKLRVIKENGWLKKDDKWEGWDIGFHESGHDVGAMSVFIGTPGNKRIMFTGDISSHEQRIAPGVMLPDEEFLDGFFDEGEVILFTEGTNANRSGLKGVPKSDIKELGYIGAINKVRKGIKDSILEAVESTKKRGGVVFIPSFAKQRAAEITIFLVEAGYRVHIDGLAKSLAQIEFPAIQTLIDEGKVVPFEREWRIASKHRSQISQNDDPCGHEPCIVVSPSATLEGGNAIEHCEYLLPKINNVVMFMGHLFEGSSAKHVFNVEYGKTVSLNSYGKKIPVNVRCEVLHFDLTAHDYQEALIERIKRTKARNVIVHHCPSEEDYKAFEKQVKKLSNPPDIQYASHIKLIHL